VNLLLEEREGDPVEAHPDPLPATQTATSESASSSLSSNGEYAERFWSKVDKSGACWEWTASRDCHGYGSFCGPGRQTWLAHRFAIYLATGEHPADSLVLHSCDNPPCCNPAHLRCGTVADNVRDALERGRYRYGLNHCARGHEYTPENTYTRASGKRMCRTCHRDRGRTRYHANQLLREYSSPGEAGPDLPPLVPGQLSLLEAAA
jgi:hypothetical protein